MKLVTSRVITRDKDKRALISKLSEAHAELALFYDDLPEAPPYVNLVQDGVAIIPAPYDYDELEKWWYYGNWNLISPAKTDFEAFNTFKHSDAEIAKVMRLHGLSMIIDSFHDDIEWKVHEYA